MDKYSVSIIMGSANDWEVMQQAAQQSRDEDSLPCPRFMIQPAS